MRRAVSQYYSKYLLLSYSLYPVFPFFFFARSWPASRSCSGCSGQPAGSGYQAEPHWEKSSFGQQSSYTQSGAGYGQPSAGYGRASDEAPLVAGKE